MPRPELPGLEGTDSLTLFTQKDPADTIMEGETVIIHRNRTFRGGGNHQVMVHIDGEPRSYAVSDDCTVQDIVMCLRGAWQLCHTGDTRVARPMPAIAL